MRRSLIVSLLAAAAAVGVWSLATTAQDIDASDCENACYDQKEECITVCGEHANPVECEESCDDRLEDCLRRCG